jgi:hypothetical protein
MKLGKQILLTVGIVVFDDVEVLDDAWSAV